MIDIHQLFILITSCRIETRIFDFELFTAPTYYAKHNLIKQFSLGKIKLAGISHRASSNCIGQ